MGSTSPSEGSSLASVPVCDRVDECCKPDFIYGGPFIKVGKIEPFLDTVTPRNLLLQGTFKRSFAYYSLKERLPIILTKVIDYCNRKRIDADYIKFVSKLKSDLVTNKKYEYLKVDTRDARKWNVWIDEQEQKHYFTNAWIFTECYVYRRLREGCELSPTLNNFDPFEEQKDKTFADSLEPMCIVADKLVTMLPQSDKEKRKADFITLLKLCLWANKCDLSLSAGEHVNVSGQKGDPAVSCPAIDPLQMIIDFKDKLLVDDTAKIADTVVNKAEAVRKAIENNTTFKFQCSCHRLATLAGVSLKTKEQAATPTGPVSTDAKSPASAPPPQGKEEAQEGAEEPPKVPCPAKMTVPNSVMFDIICDNAGYELFADLCLAHFLISQQIVQKIRFHVKNMPWFVSDVTLRDFKYVIDGCAKASYTRTLPPQPGPVPKEGEEPPPPEDPLTINADNLRAIATQWQQYVQDGTFLVMDEDFWTWPHCYKDMKKYDYNLYRKLQYPCALLFKGDLNYRKLLGEKNWNPYTSFETALQGFIPAPLIAVRTVKADLICGLPKGTYEKLNKLDEKWMEKGDYGVIQLCAKAEPLKVSGVPCLDYGKECFGSVCPVHTDM